MITDQVTCDVCGEIKRETNHWLVVVSHTMFAGIMFIPAEAATRQASNPHIKYDDICGHACAHKRLSQYLETLNPLTPKGIPDGKEDLQS